MEVYPVPNYENRKDHQRWDISLSQSLPDSLDEQDEEFNALVEELAGTLEQKLRAAKSEHFSTGEVLLPYGLLQSMARDVLRVAENEPCGLRGCNLYLEFVGDHRPGAQPIVLGMVDFDPSIASNYEIRLMLKQSTAGWNNFLPQFIKKITRGGTVMIDSTYKLIKNSIYSSCFVE